MNEQQTMLSEMADGLFAELGAGASLAECWPQIEEMALPSLLIDEDAGGFGGTWDDARIVFRLAGYHALGLPVVEAIVAAHVASSLGFEGRGTIAASADGTLDGDGFTGTITGVCAGDGADYVVAPFEGGAIVVAGDGAEHTPRKTVSGEGRGIWMLTGGRAERAATDVFALGAFARTAQIAGALDAALAQAVAYANDRKQFGRPLAKFQAMQQNLATFACEAAAANCAAIGAAQALDRGDGSFEIAVAKLRANQAVGTGTAIAHQAHGAIGFTEEYPLHPLTRRLWSWRSEFGGDSYWAREVGGKVLAAGADAFWPDLTARTD